MHGIRLILQFLCPADPADKLYAGICLGITDPEHRGKDAVLQNGDIETGNRIVVPVFGTDLQKIPAALQIHSDLALGGWNGCCLIILRTDDLTDLLCFFQESIRRETVEIVDDPVVIHDLEFVLRKEHGEEVVELLFSCISGVLLPAHFSDTDSGCAAVMSVRDINAVNAGKCMADLLDTIADIAV